MSMRSLLKKLGVTAQREIELAVRRWGAASLGDDARVRVWKSAAEARAVY